MTVVRSCCDTEGGGATRPEAVLRRADCVEDGQTRNGKGVHYHDSEPVGGDPLTINIR
jgi:hypothetical protein